ncbi:MAG TPA: hypothetical protein VM802_03555 [Chitinophaga sp.]|uniref:hypothetical protein n=1 Tax=Chitinophaga sp. TaxID=1869181 RepID=UPI002B6248C8|nr:hypothetical protein [Chitinophaga sp.]HVI43910.1 hypothetical protein [Chitinophaga sp.]
MRTLSVLLLLVLASCAANEPIANNMSFADSLSSYRLFKEPMFALAPNDSIVCYELSSTLFTDYAEKQRLIKLPPGASMHANGDGLPDFPEGTLIAKTFYYGEPPSRRIVETRLLIKHAEKWNAAVYQWNREQTAAILLTGGAVVEIASHHASGKIRYQIPAAKDCSGCHRNGDQLMPIGPKLGNMNRTIMQAGVSVNQLEALHRQGYLSGTLQPVSQLPDYNDTSRNITERGRAYLEMNCAHCHQPGGWAGHKQLDLRYKTAIKETGILLNRSQIMSRMALPGDAHMPKTGTTLLHAEGVELIRRYVDSLH